MDPEPLIVSAHQESFSGGGNIKSWFWNENEGTPNFTGIFAIVGAIMLLLVVLLVMGIVTLTQIPGGESLVKKCADDCVVKDGACAAKEGFGNLIQPTKQPSGANPNPRYQELSQSGMGAEGLVFNERTRKYEYHQSKDENLALINATHGGRADMGASGFSSQPPNYTGPSYNRWRRDDREKKAMRQYAYLKRRATEQGTPWEGGTFNEWYKGKFLLDPDNHLGSDAYFGTLADR